ncbi:MAG: hypothetical protein GYB33_07890 [Gammaproteobacteria bacterium]|nr:hypothetical protein [Gammaproteobacteria bacterium]
MHTLKIALKVLMAGLILLPPIATAHSSHNPIDDIAKYDQTVTERQAEFEQARQTEEKMQNLQDQISALERKMLSLRILMASDFPHIKEKMSKYKLNYMKSVDDTLAQLKKVLKQTDTLLDQ